ncbi:MAG: hypothetical protein OEM05_12845 [Myxococcales bacterium]|nr:hypothetical protein [Myxococcales bacterium]
MRRWYPIEGLVTAAAIFALGLAGATHARAQATGETDRPGPFTGAPAGQTSVSQLRADLVRRGSGEWVMVNLRPREAPASARPAQGASPVLHPSVRAVLREYERGFERRDADRLASVLLMDPSERAHVQRLFDESSALSLSVHDVSVVFHGDHASLAFDQRLVASTRPRLARAADRRARRSMIAHDAYGNWDGIVESD